MPCASSSAPDWNGEVRPTVRLSGGLAFTNAAVRGVPVESVRAHFSYSNRVWRLPDLALVQGKTRLEISGLADDGTKDFQTRLRGRFDPETARFF